MVQMQSEFNEAEVEMQMRMKITRVQMVHMQTYNLLWTDFGRFQIHPG